MFSDRQITRAHHLLTEHKMDVNQIADVMGTSVSNANYLLRMVRQKYPDPKQIIKPVQKKYSCDKKPVDLIEDIKAPFVRPKAVYSNKRIYDLI